VYDRTGSLEDSEQLSGDQFDSLYAFYRDMYTPVTEADLDAFHLKYRGSEEERAEVLRYYARYRGNMGLVFMSVMCSDPDRDSHRFMDIVDAAVAAGEAAAPSKNYKAWAKKTAALPRPADPLAPPKKEKAKGKKGGGGDSEAALVAQIRRAPRERRCRVQLGALQTDAAHCVRLGPAEANRPRCPASRACWPR
jgi:DnaJ family protein C protein 9